MADSSKLRRLMAEKDLDAMIALSPENVYYISGHLSPVRDLLVSPAILSNDANAKVVLVTDALESEAILSRNNLRLDVRFYGKFSVESQKQPRNINVYSDPVKGISEVLRESSVTHGRIGIEETFITLNLFKDLRKELPDATFIDASDILASARKTKSESEIMNIRKAVKATEEALKVALSHLTEGITEIEITSLFKTSLIRQGADCKFAFIAAGIRSAIPIVKPSEYRAKKGDIIHFDVGGVYNGYHSDIGRTAVIGKPSEKQKRVYEALLGAQQKAVKAMKPGVVASSIFHLGQQSVREAGYPQFWRHHIGHGIGIGVHEAPLLGNTSEPLEKGMVLAVEIPYYIVGIGGFRVEDTVLIRSDSCESLSTISRELYEA